jgi:hypothetical protein
MAGIVFPVAVFYAVSVVRFVFSMGAGRYAGLYTGPRGAGAERASRAMLELTWYAFLFLCLFVAFTTLFYYAGRPKPPTRRDWINAAVIAVLLAAFGGAHLVVDLLGPPFPAALFRALQTGDLPAARAALDEGAEVNAWNDLDGMRPLHIASAQGNLPMVRLLLGEGARPNVRNREGATPLKLASRDGHGGVAALLRRHGAQE